MDVVRLPSGISFATQQWNSGLASADHRVEELPFRRFNSASIAVAGEQQRYCLPLLEISQDVRVVGATSRSLLAQTFVNSSNTAIQEANYCFPLYDGSVIISFRCWLDGKQLLEGKVKPKAEAKAEYKDGVARQRVAALLEEHTPEIFETVLGNIPPQKIVKVEITYVNELKPDSGGYGMLVTIPTSIAPRYGTPPTGYLASRSTVENGLKIQVEVSASSPIQKLESLTHPISVEMGSEGHPTRTDSFGNLAARGFDPKKARASLSDRAAVLGRDFVLLIVTSSSHSSPRALIECNPSHPDHSVIMTTIVPREIFAPHLSSKAARAEIVFVADRSGSMLDKMEALTNALGVLLERIPEQCVFNICSFGSQHSLLWPRSRSSTPTNLGHASEHLLASFRADLGGTELLPALKTVVQQRIAEEDLRTEIIVLTDGEVWNTEATIDFVRTSRTSANDKIRYFALGIGNTVSHRLVEGIGRHGGGYAEVVAVDTSGYWESRVIHMLNGALTPSSWKCKISLEQDIEPYMDQIDEDTKSNPGELPNAEVQRPVCVQAPFQIPTLHAFSQLSVFFMIDRKISLKNSIKIQAVASTGETHTILLPLEKIEDKLATIHYLAAKALMNDFETEQSWLHSKYKTLQNVRPIVFEEIVRQEAESIGKQWSITGKWTSFVAVDHGNKLENVVSLYKAEKDCFSELAVPLRPLMGVSDSVENLRPFMGSFDDRSELSTDRRRQSAAWGGPSIYRSESYACAGRSTASGWPSTAWGGAIEAEEIRSGSTTPSVERSTCSAVKTREETLATLIEDQNSMGFFPLSRASDRKTVLASYRPTLPSEFEAALKSNQEVMALEFIFETIIVTDYIQQEFLQSILLWDSAATKAHNWVREKVKDDSVRAKLYRLVQENFRDESMLASSTATKLYNRGMRRRQRERWRQRGMRIARRNEGVIAGLSAP